jgi:phenylalanyl-tRNA synthetase beta chain
MRFSFSLIKKLAPGKYDAKTLAEELNLKSFETVYLGGDVLDISVSPNRFSDAASHLGIAREAAVIFDCQLADPLTKAPKFETGKIPQVKIQDSKLCPRYLAAYAENIKVGPSPKWLKEVLETCGLRSINNVVDVMNYVMLEIGQPLHAFDADKLQGGIKVRQARKSEKIETIDGQKFNLDSDILVIADSKQALAIAGIKGGKASEVSFRTKKILVEAASFNGAKIYKSSKKLGLRTDAAVRFMHDLSPELAALGMIRALALLKELGGAKIYKPVDVYPEKQPRKLIKLHPEKIYRLIGFDFPADKLAKNFEKLGFRTEKGFWVVPPLRLDVNDVEDLAEEAARFFDYNKLPAKAPLVALGAAEEEEQIVLKDKVRNFLKGAGFSEVYNYSFVSDLEAGAALKQIFGFEKAVALANPISSQLAYLRDSLVPGLARNLKDNLRFAENIRVFEIGKIFGRAKNGVKESLVLGAAIVAPNSVLELKGLVDGLLSQLGLSDYLMPDLNLPSKVLKSNESLRLETDEHQVLGYLGALQGVKNGAVLELDLEKLLREVDEEREFEPIAKYPAIIRDVSILVSKSIRAGQILNFLYSLSPKLVEDVDLIDYYENPKLGVNRKSFTFRIVFRAADHTLTDAEVDREVAIINQVLTERFNAELR